jgi:hypothetical protein
LAPQSRIGRSRAHTCSRASTHSAPFVPKFTGRKGRYRFRRGRPHFGRAAFSIGKGMRGPWTPVFRLRCFLSASNACVNFTCFNSIEVGT